MLWCWSGWKFANIDVLMILTFPVVRICDRCHLNNFGPWGNFLVILLAVYILINHKTIEFVKYVRTIQMQSLNWFIIETWIWSHLKVFFASENIEYKLLSVLHYKFQWSSKNCNKYKKILRFVADIYFNSSRWCYDVNAILLPLSGSWKLQNKGYDISCTKSLLVS